MIFNNSMTNGICDRIFKKKLTLAAKASRAFNEFYRRMRHERAALSTFGTSSFRFPNICSRTV